MKALITNHSNNYYCYYRELNPEVVRTSQSPDLDSPLRSVFRCGVRPAGRKAKLDMQWKGWCCGGTHQHQGPKLKAAKLWTAEDATAS